MIFMTENKLHTIGEVADTLRVSTKTVKRLIISGELEGLLVGTRYRVSQEALNKYLVKIKIKVQEQDKK